MPVLEITRRDNHLRLVTTTHPMFSLAVDCLKDTDIERPSAQQICHRLSALKETLEYKQSLKERDGNTPERDQLMQLLQERGERERENLSLQEELQQKEEEKCKLSQRLDELNAQIQQQCKVADKLQGEMRKLHKSLGSKTRLLKKKEQENDQLQKEISVLKQLPDTHSAMFQLETKRGLKIYWLPTHITIAKDNLIKCTVGLPLTQGCIPSKSKVLMLLGATGAGKSTLINSFANYVMGVKFSDPFRYKLIVDESQESQAHSQTKSITAYTFPQMDGSPLEYALTIIDTPGFGDTQGLEKDKQLTELIKEFFSIKGEQGIDQLHGIGFVAQASLARLTPTQNYIFDAILSIFGNDIGSNIFLLTTFADGETPPLIDAVKAANVPYQDYYTFNNSALFADRSVGLKEMFWTMAQKNFKNFFQRFSEVTVQSLQLTREVLNEREQLETTIQALQEQIHAGLTKIENLKKEKQVLETSKADIAKNQDFTYQITETKLRKQNLKDGEHATNCLKCNFTCHRRCTLSTSSKQYRCSAMVRRFTPFAYCGACPGECSWEQHESTSYVIEYYQDIVTKTKDDIAKRYQSALDSKAAVESVIKGMEDELDALNGTILTKIQHAKRSKTRLEEIALKPNPLTDEQYIELLIKSEEQQKKDGFLDRIAALQKVKERAQMLSKLKDVEEKSTALAVFTT